MKARSLIREVYGTAAATDRGAEERFFQRLRVPDGVYKTTVAHRLDDVNRLVIDLLPTDRPLRLMDVAVSTGVTTLDWSEQLAAAGIAHTMIAGDRYTDALWISFGWADVVLDLVDRQAAYVDVLGRGIDLSRDSWWSTATASALTFLARHSRLGRRVKRIQLVSPQVCDCAAITVLQDDVFCHRPELEGRFHALRAANILNRGYFDDDRISRGVANLLARLRPNGLLIICRTDSRGMNHGTVFRSDNAGSEVVARIGDGSEIEDIVLSGRGGRE